MNSLYKYVLSLMLIFSTIASTAQIEFIDSVGGTKPEPIPISDITSRIELVTKQLKNIDKKTQVHKSVTQIDSLIPIHEEALIRKQDDYSNFKNSHPNKQKVINYINQWSSYTSYLDAWQTTLNGYIDKNNIWQTQLKSQNAEWEVTLSQINASKSPEVYKNIVFVSNSIDDIIAKLEKQNDHFLELETDILIQKESIIEVLDDLERWKQSAQFSILYKRHKSIWRISPDEFIPKTGEFDSWTSFKGKIRGIRSYLRSPENNLIGFNLVLFLITLLLWRIKRSFNSFGKENKDAGNSDNLVADKLPYAIAFVLALSTIVYFSHTPNLLSELLLLICLIAAQPILKKSIHPKFNGLTLVITAFYLMNTLKGYVWYTSAFYRFYLLLESIIVLAAVIYYTWPYLATRRIKVSELTRLLIHSTPLVFVIMLLSIVANILGYTNLTDLFLALVVKGGVLFVILNAMLITLKAITNGSIHLYFSKRVQYDFKYKHYLEKKANQLVNVFSYSFLIIYFLHVVDVYDVFIDWLTFELAAPIQAGAITFTWGSILTFAVVLIGSFMITSFISKIVDGGALNFLKLPKGVPNIISVIVRYFLIAFGFVLSLSYLGMDLSKFNLMAGALGLGIGFGLQNIISNFISGLILIFERPIQSKDVIEVGNLLGVVKKIGVRSSNIRTFNGAEVVVPNSNLISNEVINWTLSDNVKRIEINIGAAYGTDLQTVVDILQDAAASDPIVLKEPTPVALFDKFGDSSLDFRLLYWVPVDSGIKSKSDISIDIYNRFKEKGIVIPFPQRDVHVKEKDQPLKLDTSNEIEDDFK